MIGVLNAVLPVAVMLCIGVIARRTGLFSRAGIDAMKKLVVNVTLPAVLFSAFATAQYSAKSALMPLYMFGICALGYVLGRLAARVFKLASRFAPFLMTGYEAGMLGYALLTLLVGGSRLGAFAVLDIGHVLFVFTLYKALLLRTGEQKPALGPMLRDLFTSPTVIAILAGVAFGASGLYGTLTQAGLNGPLHAVLDFVAKPTGAVILLTIGYDLVFGEIRWGAALRTAAARVAVSALLFAATLPVAWALLGRESLVTFSTALMFLLPPPYVLPVMADDPGERAYVASSLSLLTLLTVVGFAVLAIWI